MPFLIISLSTLLVFTTLRWILDIKLGLISVNETILSVWIPLIIPWIPILIWLKKPVKILNLRGKREDGYLGYQFGFSLLIAVPIIVAQNYLENRSFDLVTVQSTDEILNYPQERFFQIKDYSIEKTDKFQYFTSRTSGRNNSNLNFYAYFVCPFESSNKQIYLGIKFHKRIKNRGSYEKKNEEYKTFIIHSIGQMASSRINDFNYFVKEVTSDDQSGFLEACPQTNKVKSPTILVGHQENFEDRKGATFGWIFGAFIIANLIMVFMVAIPKIDKKQLRLVINKSNDKDEDLAELVNIFNPFGPNRFTGIICASLVITFFVSIIGGIHIISPTSKELIEVGGLSHKEFFSGEYWRIFSSMFLHAGLMHLAMNLFGLIIASIFLETKIKTIALITVYLVSGICACIASLYWNNNSVTVGASGAIFGMYGLITALTILKKYPKHELKSNFKFLGLYLGINLLFGLLNTGIDNAAHFGGFLSGLLVGLIFFYKVKMENN